MVTRTDAALAAAPLALHCRVVGFFAQIPVAVVLGTVPYAALVVRVVLDRFALRKTAPGR